MHQARAASCLDLPLVPFGHYLQLQDARNGVTWHAVAGLTSADDAGVSGGEIFRVEWTPGPAHGQGGQMRRSAGPRPARVLARDAPDKLFTFPRNLDPTARSIRPSSLRMYLRPPRTPHYPVPRPPDLDAPHSPSVADPSLLQNGQAGHLPEHPGLLCASILPHPTSTLTPRAGHRACVRRLLGHHPLRI